MRLFGTLAGTTIGAYLGSVTGVAALGTAVNGMFVFGPIGAVLGFALCRKYGEKTNADPASRDALESAEIDIELDRARTAANVILAALINILAAVWNISMWGLARIGIMPVLQRHPWGLLLLVSALLVIVLPFGLLLVGAGLVALQRDVASENAFRID